MAVSTDADASVQSDAEHIEDEEQKKRQEGQNKVIDANQGERSVVAGVNKGTIVTGNGHGGIN